ncbi:MAG: hypothetical protein KGL69_01385 [Alphaproteobacteria bacterium]|nr:hypothetical protein [Alphaproteobacteria bacterium]
MTSPYVALSHLGASTLRLGLESSEVVGLRWLQAVLAMGELTHEATLMVAEKAQAALDAQFLIALSVVSGRAEEAPARTVALYRRRVQANRHRLAPAD